jgi:hypothetical protein
VSGPCTPAFERLAGELGGFSCDGAAAIVNLHNPFGLTNPTLLVLEVSTLIGAGLSLAHALRRRRAGDPGALAVWIGALAYLLVIEPPLYFPDVFGIEDRVGLIFVHNEFTVQFLYDRLPLYIVALYPATLVLVYEIARVLGVFERHNAVVGSVAVGFIYEVFYEIFDHVGPQLRWWIWNPDVESNAPSLASVPVSSMVIFGAVGAFGLTLLVRLLVARGARADGGLSGPSFLGRAVLAGALVPAIIGVAGLPTSILAAVGPPDHTVVAVAFAVELALVAAVGAWAIAVAWRDGSAGSAGAAAGRYVLIHGGLFVVTLVGLWTVALPRYLGAVDGITEDGTPIGSLPYALACLAVAATLLGLVAVRRGADQPTPSASTAVAAS